VNAREYCSDLLRRARDERPSIASDGTDIYIGLRMRAVAMTVCVLVLALVLAACGDNGSGSKNAMEVKFQRIDYEMGNMENLNSAYGSQLTKATQRYIALIREYADLLGPAEVKRRLAQKRDEVAPYCLPCSATLDFEASRY
jgi:hypothetical protein